MKKKKISAIEALRRKRQAFLREELMDGNGKIISMTKVKGGYRIN